MRGRRERSSWLKKTVLTGSAPILAIGLEAADPTLLARWRAAGYLPNLDRLIRDGSYRRLHSCTAVASGATWPSITTGTSPAKHGMGFYHRQLRNGTYRIVKKYADEIQGVYFWKHLSAAGRRVALFDVPATHALSDVNGIQVIGWGAEALNWKQCSLPPELFEEIYRRFGRHPLDGWYQGPVESVRELSILRERLREGTKTRTRIAEWLLGREPWDMFMVVYPETHWAGHYFYHLLDEANPRYDAEIASDCGEALLEIYREIDASLAVLTRQRAGSTVFVFSNTGMGQNYSGRHLVPAILRRLGMADARVTDNVERDRKSSGHWGAYALQTIESLVSAKNIERMRKVVPEKMWDKYTRLLLQVGSGWRHSKAFDLPSDYSGAVRINLKGREPHGTVPAGDEYDRLCEELTREFLALVNPVTGRRAVRQVTKLRDRFKGDCVDELPDIIVEWEGSEPIDELFSNRIGRVAGVLPDKRSGAHQTYGFLIANGRRIRQTDELAAADIVDIAPTVLHLQGLTPPQNMDGRVLADMIEPETRNR